MTALPDPPTLLLLGPDGQVGWELRRALAPLGRVLAWSRREADLADAPALADRIRALKPAVLVNAAAYTAVDKAEADEATCRRINAQAPHAMAQAMQAVGGWLVHYSTDYVFDGSGSRPWQESDPTGPLNAYGRSKLEGEQVIRASGCRHLILRTSWVYAARGANFARTMLKLAQEREALKVVADQHGAPTGADLIADVTAHVLRTALARPEVQGTYHLAAAGCTHWQAYAQTVVAHARRLGWPLRCGPEQIAAVTTADYPTPARRPANSRLDTRRLQRTFGLTLPAWELGIERLVQTWNDAGCADKARP